MEIEDEMIIEDDLEILDVIQYGFPRRIYVRTNYIVDMDDLAFYRRFRLTKEATLSVLRMIEDRLECDNDL